MYKAISNSLREFERWRANQSMKKCNRLGADTIVDGVPVIKTQGKIELGNGIRLISSPVPIHFVVELGAILSVGDRVSIEHGAGIACNRKIEIGSDTVIGAFSLLMDNDFHVPGDFAAQPKSMPIHIGRNVKIGRHVVILKGSVIGDNVTVADRSVVTGNILPGQQVSGVPACTIQNATHMTDETNGSKNCIERVIMIAMRTFRLEKQPDLFQRAKHISTWDSLGSLYFLTALEEEFGVALDESALGPDETLESIAIRIEQAVLCKTESGFRTKPIVY